MQGYGLTETCATATIMDVNDVAGVEVVGPPLTNVDIKLRSWDEGYIFDYYQTCIFQFP